MEKGVIGIIFISLFILFGSVAFITGQEGENGEDDPLFEGEGGGGGCTPDCTGGKLCGGDGCGGSCGTCTGTDQCSSGQCVECIDNGDCASGESCVSGSCVDGSATCSDTDGGIDYSVKGTCNDATTFTPIDDECTDSNTLDEYSCSEYGLCGVESKTCDGVCVDGACVASTGCTSNADCASGESCSVGGICVAPSTGSCESSYIFSDFSTLITETTLDLSISLPITARPAEIFPAWTADIPEARWIWAEATVSNPTENTTVEFTKTFEVSDMGGTIDGKLIIATDNSYSCTLNDVFVGGDEGSMNFADSDKDTYTLTNLQVGENTLVCEVKNWEQEGGTAESNTAGLLYGLSVDSGFCDVIVPSTCTDTDGGRNYLSSGSVFVDEGVGDEIPVSTDSCSADGSTLTEYYCEDGAITSIDYSCDCISDSNGGYCRLSDSLVCKEFSSHLEGDLIDVADMVGFVDENIQDLLLSEEIVGITLSGAPARSRVANELVGDAYYCGLDLLWHGVKQNVQDIGCINDPSLDCDSNTACLEDYECVSNSCVDGYCISISAELIAQRGILVKIWCVVTNLPSFIADGQDSLEYLQCVEDAFGG